MKLFKKTYTFDKSEIFIIFLLFIFCGILVFSVGIMTGKKMLENECRIMIENAKGTEQPTSMNETTMIDDNEISKPENPKTVVAETKTEAKVEEDNISKNVEIQNYNNNNKEDVIDLSIREVTADIKNKYTVQVSAYQNELEAKKEALRIYNLGYKSVYYMPVKLAAKGVWYRIGVGFFPKKDSAEIFAELLKKQAVIESYLIRKID